MSNNLFFFGLQLPPLEQLAMLITLGEGRYREYKNTERELYFDLYRRSPLIKDPAEVTIEKEAS